MIKDQTKESGLFLTAPQAAKFLNISKTTLNKMIVQKKIRWFRTPGGHFRIHREDLFKIAYQGPEVI